MNTEQTAPLQRRASVHAALADVTRLRIVDLLAVSDRSACELGASLGIASNLLAHHLRALESADLVTRRRSEGDARRSYLSLNAHDEWLLRETGGHDGAVRAVPGRLRLHREHRALAPRGRRVEASEPRPRLLRRHAPRRADPRRRHRSRAAPRPPSSPTSRRVALGPDDGAHDLVVTVCDRAHEDLDGRDWAHWSVPDPVPHGGAAAFDAVYEEVASRAARLAVRVSATAS